MSYPWDAIGIIALFAILAIALVVLLSKYQESRTLRRRLAELRSIILSREDLYLGQVKQDRNGGYAGRLILPSGGELPILIWRVPGLGPYGDVSQEIISEPVRLMRSGGSTPELGPDESGPPEFAGEPPAFPRPKLSLTDIANAVYSGSYSPPAIEQLPDIPEERWDEFRDRLRRLKSSREGPAGVKFGRAMIKPLKLRGLRERPAETTQDWARRKLLGIVNSRSRLM